MSGVVEPLRSAIALYMCIVVHCAEGSDGDDGQYEKLNFRQSRGPMVPSLSVALRMLLLVRTAGAMYSIISDCDEGELLPANALILELTPVFNFFEPLHYFQHNSGFQTWELSPQFAVRSWSYLLLHWPLATLGPRLFRLGKVS